MIAQVDAMSMKTDVEVDARNLRRLLSAGPTVSVYLNRAGGVAESAADERLKALFVDQEISPSEYEALTGCLVGSRPDAGVVAAFISAGDPVPIVVEMPGARLPDLTVQSPIPYVRPLVAWLQERPPHVLVLADCEGADIEIHPGGTQQRIVHSITGLEDATSRPGLMTRTRQRCPVKDPAEHIAFRVANALYDELLGSPVGLLLLAGDIRVLHDIGKYLPGGLRRRVAIRYVPGGLMRVGRARCRGPLVEQHIHAWVAEQDQRLVSRIAQEAGSADWAMEGASATLRALSRGQVRSLVIVDDPQDRRVAWFDRESTQVALSKDALIHPGTPVSSACLIDVALRGALLGGADVRLLPPATSNAPAEGIGALCRFGG
ncbi:hypothetical protein LUW76_09655 [Actinomadura madurae]|uniref:baeRF2 domain-containing protein n=1 Tax=Actinomadura madurae TaxID=1993 RepID=UPI002025EC8A|nr:hypothetical protein [Actinomadura madurae]URM94562.1 hypothetical protein LUW76_09655 [Actinomadura madurae]URN05272.1 hypothetical protein LUW74_19440 [Actinomadura madurae]